MNKEEKISEALKNLHELISNEVDEDKLKLLGRVSFLIGSSMLNENPELDGLGQDLSEWARLKTESAEWAEKHGEELKEDYGDYL